MAKKEEEEGFGGGLAGEPDGGRQRSGEIRGGAESGDGGEAVAEGFFEAVEAGVGEFAEQVAIEDEAIRLQMGEQEEGADGGGSAPGRVVRRGQRGCIEGAAGGVEGGFGRAEEGFGGGEGEGLAEGGKGQLE